jgi:hypothetical protein
VQSIFQLAPESRLPRWFDVSGYQRNDLTMTITIYSTPIGGSKAKMIIYGPPPERKKLIEMAGRERWHPFSEKDYDKKYPNYSIITVNGGDEVFEQKQPGDILYITDDPKLGFRLRKHTNPRKAVSRGILQRSQKTGVCLQI